MQNLVWKIVCIDVERDKAEVVTLISSHIYQETLAIQIWDISLLFKQVIDNVNTSGPKAKYINLLH